MKNFMKRFLSLAFALVLTAGAIPALTTNADAAAATLTGYAHVQGVGNTKSVTGSSITLGTAKSGARLEAVSLKLNNVSGSISYQAHVQNKGWMSSVSNGKLAGTTGKALRLEAIKIWLVGDVTMQYDVQYRAYIQNTKKWTDWMSNGNVAGTTGKAYTLEAIEVRLVAKKIPAGYYYIVSASKVNNEQAAIHSKGNYWSVQPYNNNNKKYERVEIHGNIIEKNMYWVQFDHDTNRRVCFIEDAGEGSYYISYESVWHRYYFKNKGFGASVLGYSGKDSSNNCKWLLVPAT